MSVVLSPTPDRKTFERISRSSDVYSEPPWTDLLNAALVALLLYVGAAVCLLIHYLDRAHLPLLFPDGWIIFVDLFAALFTALATWTVLWYADLEWCWVRRYPSFVYWLYRHDASSPPHMSPAVYAGESVNPTERVKGHLRDGERHWRKQDWAKGVDMRIIRATRPRARHKIEDRAKLYGSFQARMYGRFWGGAEGFIGATSSTNRERIDKLSSIFWVLVWSWGAICFPRHYGTGRPHRSVWRAILQRLAHK